MNDFASFLSATERCVAQSKTMLTFEQEKRQALLSDDLTRLESMIQAQQAAIMKMESLEKQRLEAQEKAGFHQMKADEVLANMESGPDKEALAELVRVLRTTLEEIRYHNTKAVDIARNNLQILDMLSTGKEQQQQHGRQGVYSPKQAGAGWQGSPSFEKKI